MAQILQNALGALENDHLSAYDRLMIARSAERPKIDDYVAALFDDFLELSGDRLGGEDRAIMGGIGFFGSRPVTVIGHRKGHEIRENMADNFGMPGPEGYRKALRLMREAEKFGRPVITFVDTPGAYPGREAEENGISAAIAENLAAMSELRIPILTIITGEGNSGGALAIAVADRVLMLENAVYSILSPEGFASILWKDGTKVREACDVMKMTSRDLLKAGLIDRVIPEPRGGIQKNPSAGYLTIRQAISGELERLVRKDPADLVRERYEKYRKIGTAAPAERETNAPQKTGAIQSISSLGRDSIYLGKESIGLATDIASDIASGMKSSIGSIAGSAISFVSGDGKNGAENSAGREDSRETGKSKPVKKSEEDFDDSGMNVR